MTLLELTVVIAVLLSLIALVMLGGRAWMRGADRALCLMNLEAVQKGVRGYANLHDCQPGDLVAGLESQIIGENGFVDSTPQCPGAGAYGTLGDQIPNYGELYMTCSLASADQHQPAQLARW